MRHESNTTCDSINRYTYEEKADMMMMLVSCYNDHDEDNDDDDNHQPCDNVVISRQCRVTD